MFLLALQHLSWDRNTSMFFQLVEESLLCFVGYGLQLNTVLTNKKKDTPMQVPWILNSLNSSGNQDEDPWET